MIRLLRVLKALVRGNTAATIVEYAMLLALVAALCIGVIHKPLAKSVRRVFHEVADVLDGVHERHDDARDDG